MGLYDIEKAFAAIEEELLSSMMRNMQRHKNWEDDEGFNWPMWQSEQLKNLEQYKKKNRKKFPKQFKKLNRKIEDAIQMAYDMGQMDEEIKILEAVKDGFKAKKVNTDTDFFKLNDRKLEALINATTGEIGKAETAILRMADDKYRQVIFNAQMYANTGAGTYEQAVDMATKDFISSGLNCVVYSNGARHTLEDYARMAIRTAAKRAYLQGEGVKRAEWGVSTVIINKRGNPCPKCLPFVGKIMIDDVWSNGKKSDGKYPLLSRAIAKGLYHPNCRDSHTTYFPELSDLPEPYNEDDQEEVFEVYQNDQKRKYAERQAEKYDRLARHSLAPENKKTYAGKAKQWEAKGEEIIQYASLSDGTEIAPRLTQTTKSTKEKLKQELTKLTEEDIMIIRRYTGNLAMQMNREIANKGTAVRYKTEMEALDAALEKGIITEDIIVLRQTIPEFMNVFPKGYVPSEMDMLQLVGTLVKNDSFISTSLEPFDYLMRNVRISIQVPKGYKGALYIKDIASPRFRYQEEVLFKRGMSYIIEDVKIIDGIYYIEARIV